jgi:hypothetical protein
MCGLYKVVQTTLQATVIEHNETGPDIKLPKPGSTLKSTLMVLSVCEEATSAEITDMLNDQQRTMLRVRDGKIVKTERRVFTVSDVSTYLTILRSKGLVFQVTARRGVIGGSTWALTDAANDLIGV